MEEMISKGLYGYDSLQAETTCCMSEGNAVTLWSEETMRAWLDKCSKKYEKDNKHE